MLNGPQMPGLLEEEVKRLLILIALAAVHLHALVPPQAVPEKAFWESGNEYLKQCDGSSSFRQSLDRQTARVYDTSCSVWLVGLRQALVLEDQVRPKKQTDAATNAAKKEAEDLKALGIKSLAPIPNVDACIPDNIPGSQVQLVVLKFMKDNPGSLTGPAAWLAMGAIKTEWPCH
jgi:hypothetical protein